MLTVYKTYYNNYNVEDKEVLKELLKRYEGTLNKSTLEYLDSLIGLEFSVVKDNISSAKKENLIELELYRRIAIYNIYNRVLNLLRSHEDLDINSNSAGYEGIYVSKKLDNDNIVELFNFDYDINRSRVGEIEFYEIREKERILTDIDKKKIEISNYYLELLLNEFGLTKEDLKDDKVLVKKMPRLTIKDNIRYL